MVVASFPGMTEAVRKVAADFPDVKFVHIYSAEDGGLDNVVSVDFACWEASYVCGVAGPPLSLRAADRSHHRRRGQHHPRQLPCPGGGGPIRERRRRRGTRSTPVPSTIPPREQGDRPEHSTARAWTLSSATRERSPWASLRPPRRPGTISSATPAITPPWRRATYSWTPPWASARRCTTRSASWWTALSPPSVGAANYANGGIATTKNTSLAENCTDEVLKGRLDEIWDKVAEIEGQIADGTLVVEKVTQ